MSTAGRLALGLAIAALLFGAGVYYASEQGGEVVTLISFDPQGGAHQTRLWIVDDAGHAWLRSGQPTSEWLARLEAVPEVVVVRGGTEARYRAEPVRGAAATERINALMRERYGFADRLVSLIHDAAACVAVRLDPLPGT